MAVTNGSVVDITPDVALATSKPSIVSNFDDLLENDVDIEARVTTAEGKVTVLEANVTSTNHIAFDVTPTGVPTAIGTTSWNATTEGLQTKYTTDVTYNHGEELFTPISANDSGVEIPDGRIVRITGSDGTNPTIALADGTAATNSVIAMATETIAIGTTGRCTREGIVRGLNTSTFTAGDELWLDPSSALGEVTNTEPIGLEAKYSVGYVMKSHLTDGWIWCAINHVLALKELADLVITSIADNDIITYDSASGTWINTQNPSCTYGELYAYNNTTALALTTINTWYQVIAFDTVGLESNMTGSSATDDITITSSGIYKISFDASYSGSASETVDFQVKKNNGATSFNNIYTSRALGVGGDVGVVSASGLISLTAGDTVELWARCVTASTKEITVKYAALTLELKKYT